MITLGYCDKMLRSMALQGLGLTSVSDKYDIFHKMMTIMAETSPMPGIPGNTGVMCSKISKNIFVCQNPRTTYVRDGAIHWHPGLNDNLEYLTPSTHTHVPKDEKAGLVFWTEGDK